ncbi:hypothetical protein N9W76_03075 [Planktomarina temperata]|nr:hypothetical protein [Planktomarina temperata]
MTTSINVLANSAHQAFLATSDEEKIFQLGKTDLEFLATGATGANLSFKFRLIEEFSEDAGFILEIRKSDADGALLSSISSADNASFSNGGELNLDVNIIDDAPYYLIVKPSSADAYSEAQFEIVFDEIPTFGGLVADSSVSSEDIIAQEEAYIGTDLNNAAEFKSTSDKVSFLIDLKAASDDREIEIAYGGPSTTVEVFKLNDTSNASAKNITNLAGSTGITQSIGLIYTVSETGNKPTISRTDGKQFTATFAIGGDNDGVTSIPDPVISSTTDSLSSATFATALSGEASPGDIITLTLSSDNEADVTRTFTAEGATVVNEWANKIVDLFSEDRVTFTANAAAETIKVVFSSPESVGTFDFSINALDDPSASEEQNLASDVALAEDQSHAPTLRMNDTASSDFKMSQKVGAQINSSVTFTSGNDYALADFVMVDGDYDAVYLTLDKVAAENDLPALSITVGNSTRAISTDVANPTILSKSDFLASTFTAGASETVAYNLTVFARKLTGQNKSENFTVDSDVSTWFATEPNQTDSSSILQATVEYTATSIASSIVDDVKNVVTSSSSILEGRQGFLQVNVADFNKADNLDTDLSINVFVSTNDVSLVDPSTGVTSKSKTEAITGALLEIPFWVVSDPDLVALEAVALEVELIGSGNDYGRQLSSLYVAPVVFNVSELIPSLSTRYTNANALQPNDTNSVYKYEISLDNYADLKAVDDAILVKPLATSNASKFQIETFLLDYDADAAALSISPFTGTATTSAKVFIDNVEAASDAYENGAIDVTLLEAGSVKLELSALGLPTSVYAFDAPSSGATESAWSTALDNAFKGFKFEAGSNETASQIEISVYSKASTADDTASTLIEHELTYNNKTFNSLDLAIPNVQVTTNLASTDIWTPLGTGRNDVFALNDTAVNLKAGDGDDLLSVSAFPTKKSSIFDGDIGEDTVKFGKEISQYKVELSSSGDVKVTELASLGVLDLKNTEKLIFETDSYDLRRVDGSLSSYTGTVGNDLYVISSSKPTVTDTGVGGQDIIITTAPFISSKYQGIETVFLSGDADLTATLSTDTSLYGNSGDNEIVLSSGNHVIFESAGVDYIQDEDTSGEDTVVLSDVESAYTYYNVNGRYFVTGAQGTSILKNIEKIAFLNDVSSSKAVSDLLITAPTNDQYLEGISVNVNGDHVEGSTITANFIAVNTGKFIDLSESFSWYEAGSDTALAEGQTLELTAQHIGKTIYATVNYLDTDGKLRNAKSNEKQVAYLNDETSGVVSLSGSMELGAKLQANVLSFSDLDFPEGVIPPVATYQWYIDDQIIEGANQRELEILQSLKNSSLSVKVGFRNTYGDIEYLTSNNSSLIFEGRETAALSISSNDLFVLNSGSAAVNKSIGAIKNELAVFFSGDEVAQYSDSIEQQWALGASFDRLTVDVATSSSVISNPATSQNFTILGHEETQQNLALFLDMSGAAAGAKVQALAAQNIFIKGAVDITTDGDHQNIIANSANQVIVTGAGNDAIFSGDGDDTLSPGKGLNVINAGSGFDTINIAFDYNEEFIAYDDFSNAVLFNNGTDAVTISSAEVFKFENGITKSLSALVSLQNKNFESLGEIAIAGSARSGSQLEIIDKTFESNGIDLDTLVYSWLRGDNTIEGATEKNYTLTDEDIGSSISARMSFLDSLGNTSTFNAQLTSVAAMRLDKNGTSGDDVFASKFDNESFTGKAGADIFRFRKRDSDSQGDDLISDYEPTIDKLEFIGYDYVKIRRSLDAEGNDYFEFKEDNGDSQLAIKSSKITQSLKIKNLSDKTLKISDEVVVLNQQGEMSLSSEKEIRDVKIEGLTSLKSGIAKQNESTASDPINLSDVLSQLKHIIGLRELKANALQAGDTNNDGEVNLSDVLVNLKHIIGLREIDTFDLVTDNGFAINALDADSRGNLTLVINGDADQSHADWDFV